MTTLREAAQQALEALELVAVDAKTTPNAYEAQRQAITALRAALAEQAQPVAWMVESEGLYWTEEAAICRADMFAEPLDVVPLYAMPPALIVPQQPLRDLCAAAYQVVGVAGGPVEMLDNLVAAADGKPLPHDPGAGLPWMPAPQPLAEQEDDLTAAWMAGAAEERKRAPQPLTIERLRYALVAARIIPPAAVTDPDAYDDGVMLSRIEALFRRLT